VFVETDIRHAKNVACSIDLWWNKVPPGRLMVALHGREYRVLRADDLEGKPLGVFDTQVAAEAFARAHDDVGRLLGIVNSLMEEKNSIEC